MLLIYIYIYQLLQENYVWYVKWYWLTDNWYIWSAFEKLHLTTIVRQYTSSPTIWSTLLFNDDKLQEKIDVDGAIESSQILGNFMHKNYLVMRS